MTSLKYLSWRGGRKKARNVAEDENEEKLFRRAEGAQRGGGDLESNVMPDRETDDELKCQMQNKSLLLFLLPFQQNVFFLQSPTCQGWTNQNLGAFQSQTKSSEFQTPAYRTESPVPVPVPAC